MFPPSHFDSYEVGVFDRCEPPKFQYSTFCGQDMQMCCLGCKTDPYGLWFPSKPSLARRQWCLLAVRKALSLSCHLCPCLLAIYQEVTLRALQSTSALWYLIQWLRHRNLFWSPQCVSLRLYPMDFGQHCPIAYWRLHKMIAAYRWSCGWQLHDILSVTLLIVAQHIKSFPKVSRQRWLST